MNIAGFIDHTILRPTTLPADIALLCSEAIANRFAAICIPPYYVAQAKSIIREGPGIATVIGFPLGYNSIKAKEEEVKKAIADGADELDIVINLAALKSGDRAYLSKEIVTLLQPVRLHRRTIKVIIESGMLTDNEIIEACSLYARHKVDFIKTSTGYAEKGASVDHIRLIKQNLPAEIKIKASGGIRTFAFAKELIDAGADRIGTSAGMAIINGR